MNPETHSNPLDDRAYRREVAALTGHSEQYLYQCATGRKDMRPKPAREVELLTQMRVRRWHLRPNDWFQVWPELVGSEGAPKPIPIVRAAKKKAVPA